MTKYTFPATISKMDRTNRHYIIDFPDLPGCRTYGNGLENSLKEARSLLHYHLQLMVEKEEEIPPAKRMAHIKSPEHGVAGLITVEIKEKA